MFKKSSRVLLVTLLLFVLAGATYAFAAANTVPPTFAGDGQGVISGYVVTDVNYVLDSNPALISSVDFTLDGAASVVQISLVDGGAFFPCGNSSGFDWTCNVGGNVSVLDANLLRVIAVE